MKKPTEKLNVDTQLLALAYRNQPSTLLVNTAATLGASLVLSKDNLFWIWSFFAIAILLAGFRLWIWHQFQLAHRATATFDAPAIKHWRLLYAAGIYFAASVWLAIIIGGVVNTISHAAFFTLIAIVSGLAGGATAVIAPLKKEGRIYIFLLLVPTSITLLFTSPPNFVLSALGIIFYFVMLFSHSNNHNILRKSLVLSDENTTLINSLKDVNANLEGVVSVRTRELMLIAHRDDLTGLPNRRGLAEWLDVHFKTIPQTEAAVLFLDLDRFKQINDAKGHEIGDKILKQASLRFQDNLREDAMLARWGGDEFVLTIQPHSDARKFAIEQADNLIKAMNIPFVVDDEQLSLSLSIGVAYYPSDAETFEETIHAADLAAAEVKRVGRGQIFTFSENFAETQRYRFELGRALAAAITSESITLVYQPIINARTGQIVAFEALARWHDSQLGSVPPDKFIPFAEDTDRITELGNLVLRKACKEAKRWSASGQSACIISVNVSIKQLIAKGFVESVLQVLAETGLHASKLALEVTESLFDDEHIKHILNTVDSLKNIGISVHIDDFGTGYSSLSRLHQLSAHCIKVDKSFVSDMQNQGKVIIESATLIAKSFDLKVVAEGVETLEQARALYKLGIDFFQGYYFAEPVPEVSFDNFDPIWME